MTALIPIQEEARLATLRSLDILDTLPERGFDDLVEVVQTLLNVPIAFVSFLDRGRQWFKARSGVSVCETSRDLAFCAHTILQAQPLIVPNATLDPRFADNPLVTGEMGVRFYIGVPIVVDDQTVGTICGVDTRPRDVEAPQVSALESLGRQAEALLGLRLQSARLTESLRMEADLRASESMLRTVVESLHEGLVVQDAEGRIVLWNQSAERILGLSCEQLCGLSSLDPRWRTVREDGSPFPGDEHPAMVALRTGEVQEPMIMGVHRPDGELRWLRLTGAPVYSGGARPTSAIASFLDVTGRVEQERRTHEHVTQIEAYSKDLEAANGRLEALATTDGLTGLKNHRFFQDFLRRRIDQYGAAGMPLSVALLDVDRFKAYNDDFGHQAGDAVLRGVAEVLGSSIRATDLVARYGGEEFVIVMPGLDVEGATAMAERVRERLAATPFDLRAVTASFGVATLGPAQPDATSLIRAADEALYASKESGRNRATHWNAMALAQPSASSIRPSVYLAP